MKLQFLLVFALIQPSYQQFDASQCQISKGCHIPESTQSNGMGVAWSLLDDETLLLELFVNSDEEKGRYVAVGFSNDEHMGNEPVIECSAIGNQKPSMKFSFDKTNGKGNERIAGDYTAHFSNNTAVFENGVLYCKSNVKVSGSSENSNVFKFDPSTQYHLLLANGKTTAKGLGYHKDQSSVSRKLRLSESSPGFDQSECGKTKGCTMPAANSCYNVDGNIGASYQVISDNQIAFEIFGPANTTVNENVYVALGFSDDEKMANISVIECSNLPSETAPTMKFSYNPGFKNARIDGEPPIRAKFIQQSIGRISDGSIYCKGVVNVGGEAENPQIFKWNKNQGYHLMFAAGFSADTGLTQHWGSCVSILTFLDQVNNLGFNDATCGLTKGCFTPTDCTDGCDDIRSSWSLLSDNQIHVELTGKVNATNKYVAMGFSTNGTMGNTSVIECSSFDNSNFSMTFSYNLVNAPDYSNLRSTSDVSGLFTNRRVQFVDGVLYCSADVAVVGDANDQTVFKYDPATKYSIIMATGDTSTKGNVKGLGYHKKKRSVAPLQLLSDYTPPTAAPPPSGKGTFDSSTCGKDKACYTPPNNVDTVAYKVLNDSYIEFEISSTQSSSSGVYTALGFSNDGKMNPANVIECSSLGSQPLSMKFSTNSGYSNDRISGEEAIRSQYITNTETSYVDGKIYCKGTVRSDGNSNAAIFKYTPKQQYHLIIAKGTASPGGLGYHGTNRYISTARLLTDLGAGNESGSSNTLLILHAMFMTIAWMTMVPIAVIFARVLRSSWPTTKPGGLLIWFHIHRGANLIGIALMIAAFVLILIHKDWKFTTIGWGGKHAIIGIIALCLAWLQPFISTLRCSPNDSRRPIFNYIHRGIGVTAMVLATTAICIAGYHFTGGRHVVQLVLALIPISVIFALSLFFIIFNNVVDVDTKSFTKVNRFREFVVYGAVLIFIAVGTILSVFFGTGFS
ncbi:DOMON domain-containing protein [Caenorhabditis elegans]|uniref:DOMON domain-containing protein n=1 Tax=Caenorhabditis elegans TaxID=6239 RepID=A0A486WTC7_CAEEL|nr:DOMON domain-containing protein [Caenorhabditis elegans]VGM69477.1 DOMON domain-containing protein [Caenorhabditis elegans]